MITDARTERGIRTWPARAWQPLVGSRGEDLAARALLASAVAGIAVLVVVAVVPPSFGGLRGPRVHVAIETTATLVAASAAVLVAGRARRGASRSDAVMAAALALLAAVNGVFAIGPALTDDLADPGAGWATTIGRGVAAAMLLVAALLPAKPHDGWRRTAWASIALVAVLVSALLVLRAPLGEAVPGGGEAEAWLPGGGSRPGSTGAVSIAQAITAVLHLAAVMPFLRRGLRTRDELLIWVAAAAMLLALARVGVVADPAAGQRWVLAGDVLRLAAYGLLLAGLAREVLGLQARLAELAVVDERRRLARDLHDGLAQELAYIRRLAAGLRSDDAERVAALEAAGDRALEESRAAIAALSRPVDEPLTQALLTVARVQAERGGARVSASGPRDLRVELPVHEALERVVREATTNAVRHGRAEHVRLEVEAAPLTVRIRDDGEGFDPSAPAGAESFGLVSMRERVEALGGTLAIRSGRGHGTEVEAVLP